MHKILILTILLLASFASAEDFHVSITPVLNELYPTDEYAIYNISITNFKDASDYFSISLLDFNWLIPSTAMIVEPQDTKTIEIKVFPSGLVSYQVYSLLFQIWSRDEAVTVEKTTPLYYQSFSDPQDYVPAVKMIVNGPEDIDPRNPVSLSISLRNRNPLDIGFAQLQVSGIAEKTRDITLAPLEEKTLTMSLTPDPLIDPGQYPISVKLVYQEQVISEYEYLANIESYSSIKQDKVVESRYLGFLSIETLSLTNEGNVERTPEISRRASLFNRMISSSYPDYKVISKEGKKHMAWDVTLQPAETKDIVIRKNYIPLTIIILLLIIGNIFYFKNRSPLLLSKESRVLTASKEGISRIKVAIYLRNRTSKPVSDVVLMDKIPTIANLISDDSVGIIKPQKVTHGKSRKTLLKWSLGSLEPFEERILTYKIKSKLSIVGGLRLPPARVKFLTHDEKEKFSISNNPFTEE